MLGLFGSTTGLRNARIITYSEGVILSSAYAFVMRRLGYTNIAVYTATLQVWAADPGNPMVVDSVRSEAA